MDKFNWKDYLNRYPDLKRIKTKKEAFIHFIKLIDYYFSK